MEVLGNLEVIIWDVMVRGIGYRCVAIGLATFLTAGSLLAIVSSDGLTDPGAQSTESPEQRGDRFFRQRASGFLEKGTLEPWAIDNAITAYEEALEEDTDNLQLIFKLMEALYFKGYHVATDDRLKRELFQRLVDLDDRALELVIAETGQKDLKDLTPELQAELLRSVPGAAEAHYWAVTGWGLWGMTHNPLKALTKGVGPKIRDYSRLLTLIDEQHRDAAGLRMLGRFHTEAPKVPLITGWIDREKGLAMLRRAVEISRREPRNLLFLAEGILAHDPDRREEAVSLLRELAERKPSPEDPVEESESLKLARELLLELSPPELLQPAAQEP